jgi:sec-independent protein translocase protein TatA
MFPGLHPLDLVIVLVIALLIFGPKKLPEMGSAIGKSIKEFRKGMNELTAPKEEKEEQKLPVSSKDMSKLSLGSVAYEGESVSKAASNEAPAETPVEQ